MSVPTGARNYPAGVSDNDPYFTDESEPDVVEARRLLCGCVEFSNGELQICAEHESNEDMMCRTCRRERDLRRARRYLPVVSRIRA